ncbi:hypothetical protein BAY60_33110 [Prauserella muralis]|uniref:Esterase-like activity of phytase family protein n=1 Tax=Prauserella muralis TaxID=588067 RepID=A0A2V4AIL5_9PSEU|nr:hypothetical protein BAY60_33110 [Prauserella muralis]
MFGVLAVAGLLGGVAVPAASAAQAAGPEPVCTIGDSRITELSGLAADAEHWYAVNDGGSSLEIFVLGRDCSVRHVIENPADPYDVEDLALAGDGTLWLGDTGDNRKQRDTVALHAVSPDGDAVLYRLTYPDGQHDAEALLLGGDGTPYIVTKNVLGGSEVYRPARELSSPGPTPLERVGALDLSATETPGGPVGSAGSLLVTGAATSADGTVVALRTYTDAYLYPAPDGDIVAALQRQPVRVALPNEPQGEAIAFEPDGTLLSGTEGAGSAVRAVRGATDLVAEGTSGNSGESGASAGGAASDGEQAAGAQPDSGVPVLPGIAIAAVVAAAAVFGLSRLRRR